MRAILGTICSLPVGLPSLNQECTQPSLKLGVPRHHTISLPPHPLSFLQISEIFAQLQSSGTSLRVGRLGQCSGLWNTRSASSRLSGPLPGLQMPSSLSEWAHRPPSLAGLHWRDITFPCRKDLVLPEYVSCSSTAFNALSGSWEGLCQNISCGCWLWDLGRSYFLLYPFCIFYHRHVLFLIDRITN